MLVITACNAEEKEEECDSSMKAYETQDHYVPVQQPSYMVQPTQITGYYEQPNYHPHFVQPQMVNCPPPLLRSAPITAFCEQSYMIEQPQPSQITAYGYPQYPQNMATIQMDAYGNQSFVSNMMAPHMLAYNGNSMASFGDHTLPQYIVPQHAPPQFVNQPMPSFYDQQQESHSHQYESTTNEFDLNDSVSSLSTIYPRSVVASSASSSSDVSLSPEETDTSDRMDYGHKKNIDNDNCKFFV